MTKHKSQIDSLSTRGHFHLWRNTLDRGPESTQEQGPETNELPFFWPGEYTEKSVPLEREQISIEETEEHIHWETYKQTDGTPFELIARPYEGLHFQTINPTYWEAEQSGNTALQTYAVGRHSSIALSKEGRMIIGTNGGQTILCLPDGTTKIIETEKKDRIFSAIFLEDELLAMECEDGSILLHYPDGTTTVLIDPNGRKLQYPNMFPDKTLIAERTSGTLVLYQPDGNTMLLKTAKEGRRGLYRPAAYKDGIFAAEQQDQSILLHLQNNRFTTLRDPTGTDIFSPRFSADGTLIAERGDGSIFMRTPEGTYYTLRDPNHEPFTSIHLSPNNLLLTTRPDSNTLIAQYLHQDTAYILHYPTEQRVRGTTLLQDGTLIILGHETLLKAPSISSQQRQNHQSNPLNTPRKTF